jgi:hypothetical protein
VGLKVFTDAAVSGTFRIVLPERSCQNLLTKDQRDHQGTLLTEGASPLLI